MADPMEIDLHGILASGHGPEHIDGLDQALATAFASLIAGAPPEIAAHIGIQSGYRSVERQKQLYANALRKYGSEKAARKWVAPPGRSRHNHGQAIDIRYGSDTARNWVHKNAGTYGLHFPMSWEPWHIELAGSRDRPLGQGAAPGAHQHAPANTPAPQQPQGDGHGFGALFAQAFGGGARENPLPQEPMRQVADNGEDAALLAQNAASLQDQGRQLGQGFMPDIEAILGLKKRKPQIVA